MLRLTMFVLALAISTSAQTIGGTAKVGGTAQVAPSGGGGGAALGPDNGELATGDSNTNRPVRAPKHYSTTQSQPSGMAVTASGCVRSSNVVTCTLTGAPASPGLAVGGNVTVASMTDSGFNGTFTITALPSSTQVRWAQVAGDATTDSGTISSAKWPYPAQGGSYSDPQFGSTIERFFDSTLATATDPMWQIYSNFPAFNITREYYVVTDANVGAPVVVKRSDRSIVCSGVVGSESAGGRWPQDESNPYQLYYTSGNVLRRIINVNTGCTTEAVHTFSSYTTIRLSPNGATGRILKNDAGKQTAVLVGCASGSCPDGGQMDVFVYNITDDTLGTAYTVQTAWSDIDEVNHFPDGSFIINYLSNCTGPCSEGEGGIDYINANGTFNRNVWTVNLHNDVGVDPDGAEVAVGWYNQVTPAGPCSNRGLGAFEAATSTTRCIFNIENANNAGTGYVNIGNHVSVSGQWVYFSLDNPTFEVVESALPSTWLTGRARGEGELWACKLKGTIDGTNNCYRLAHLRGRPYNTSGGGADYRRSYKCSASMLRDADNAGSVINEVICASDFAGATSGNQFADPLLITVRAP